VYRILFLVLGVFSACGSPEQQPEGHIELIYWCAPNPQEVLLAETMVAEWHRLHPNIRIKVQPLPAGQSSEEVLLAALAAGTTPDVCSNIWPGIVPDFVRAGRLIALDTMPDFAIAVGSRAPEGLIESNRSPDGRLYHIPWKTNPIMMQYDVSMFRESGLDRAPETYSEFIESARRLTRDLNGDGRTDQWMGTRDIRAIWWQRYFDLYPLYVAATGGQTLIRDGRVQIDREAMKSVISFLRTLYADGSFPMSSPQGNPFLSRKIAMEFTGPWNISYLERNAPEGLEYDFAPIPVPDDHTGPVYTYGDHKNIAIFSSTKHPAESWAFVKFLISKQADMQMLRITRQIPLRGDLLSDPEFVAYFDGDPKLSVFAEQAAHTRSVDAVPDLKRIFDALSRRYERSAVYGKDDLDSAVDALIAELERIVEYNQ
jgi:multiple sugar transport system substrate-binding protein